MTKLLADPAASPPADARSALAAVMPAAGLAVEYRARPGAGVGSLGRRRYVALAQWAGGWVCREAKAAAPPATAWASGATTPCRAADAVARAKRSPDPFYRVVGGWVVRRLGPRSSRVELGHLATADAVRLLRAMGSEVGNVHLGTLRTAAAAVQADLAGRPRGWLADAAKAFAELLTQDWAAWRQAAPK